MQVKRTRGLGAVMLKSHCHRLKYWAMTPRINGVQEVIWKCETQWAAERALSAWYMVEAVAMLCRRLAEQCARSAA